MFMNGRLVITFVFIAHFWSAALSQFEVRTILPNQQLIYFCTMFLTDTHTHLYLEEFNDDRKEMVERALENDVKYMLLPNIDSSSIDGMLDLCKQYPANMEGCEHEVMFVVIA